MSKISDEVLNRMMFVKHNLLTLTTVDGGGFHLIICKNVLLHLQLEERIQVMKMFWDSLVPGGFFVTEQTQAMPEELNGKFEQVVPDAHLYRKIGSR